MRLAFGVRRLAFGVGWRRVATLCRYLAVIVIGLPLRAIVFAGRDADPAKRRTPNAKR
jgi:hypothetical protein